MPEALGRTEQHATNASNPTIPLVTVGHAACRIFSPIQNLCRTSCVVRPLGSVMVALVALRNWIVTGATLLLI